MAPPRPVASAPVPAPAEGKPPLYPLEDSAARKSAAPAARPAAPPPAQPPIPRSLEESSESLFGVSMRQQGGKLFGEDAEEVEVGELFADAIPGRPEVEDDVDVPLDDAPRAPARVAAVPVEESLEVPEDDEATDVTSDDVTPARSDDLISMDELFAAGAKGATKSPPAPRAAAPAAAKATPPPFGQGPLPAPYLKPVESTGQTPAAAPAAATGSGPFTLISLEGVPDSVFQFTGGGNYLIGRDKDAEVKILSNSVSRKHARIDATGKDAVLIDLGSANGTQVNGTSVNRHPLRDGDLIKVGKVVLRFKR